MTEETKDLLENKPGKAAITHSELDKSDLQILSDLQGYIEEAQGIVKSEASIRVVKRFQYIKEQVDILIELLTKRNQP